MTRRARWLLASLAVACVAAGPATSPSSPTAALEGLLHELTGRPAATTRAAATRGAATVAAAAEPLLAKLNRAYAAGPLNVEGELVGTFDVAGRRHTYRLPITGQTDGRGRFVHDAGAAGRIVAGDQRGVLFDRRRNAFATFDAPAARVAAADLEPALVDILLDENPALLFGLVTDADAILRSAAGQISVADGLVLRLTDKTITLHLNDDGTVRASDIDYTPLMKAHDAVAVKAAQVTLTYRTASRTEPPADIYAWDPPATATEFALHEEMMRPAGPATGPATRPATRNRRGR